MHFADFLNTVPAFESFTRQDIDLLEKSMTVRDFPDDHMFVRQGESADAMYLIVQGDVVIRRRRETGIGFETLGRLGPGEIFGLVSLIDRGPRTADCIADGPVRAAMLPYGAFQLLFKANARVGYHFQQLIARQLVHDLRIATASLIGRTIGQSS